MKAHTRGAQSIKWFMMDSETCTRAVARCVGRESFMATIAVKTILDSAVLPRRTKIAAEARLSDSPRSQWGSTRGSGRVRWYRTLTRISCG